MDIQILRLISKIHLNIFFCSAKLFSRKNILGKSKKRIIYKGKNEQFTNIKRSDAVLNVVKMLNEGNIEEAYSVITLFGLSAEEILENGASYEAVVGLESILK